MVHIQNSNNNMTPKEHFNQIEIIRSHALLIVLYLSLFTLCAIVLFPGVDDRDTGAMIWYNHTNVYSNWQSLFTIFVIHNTNIVCPALKDYNGLFFGTMVQYWLAQTIITAHAARTFLKQFFITLIAALFPPAWCLMIGMHKDTFMCNTLLLACATTLIAGSTQSKLRRWLFCAVAYFLLFVALAERHNGIFGVVPLAVYLASVLLKSFPRVRNFGLSRFRVTLVGLALTLTLVSWKWLFETSIITFEAYPAQMVVAWDLVGISVRSNDLCLPNVYPNIKIPITLQYLKKIYLETDNSTLFWWKVDKETPHLYFLENKNDYDQLVASWLRSIIKHPIAYLQHRTFAFLSCLGLFHAETAGNPYEYLRHPPQDKAFIPFEDSPFWIFMRRYVPFPLHLDIPDWPMRGGPYLVFLCLIFALTRLRLIRMKKNEYFLLMSGICYTFGFFFATTSNNQRYMTYLLCVSAITLAPILVDFRRRVRLKLSKFAQQKF
jgi:hypothetical protein